MNWNGRSCHCKGPCSAGTAQLNSVLSGQGTMQSSLQGPWAHWPCVLTNDLPHLAQQQGCSHSEPGSSSPATGCKPGEKSSYNGGEGESEGRILSLNLECVQVSVDNTTALAQNASGLQTTTCLYDHWNCLLPPLPFSQPVGFCAFTVFLAYSCPEPQGWFKSEPNKSWYADSSGCFID